MTEEIKPDELPRASNASIWLAFGDGFYLFALPVLQIKELQAKCGVGIGGLHKRVNQGCVLNGDKMVLIPGQAEFYALDLIETVRHGLIGGGKGMVNGEEINVTPQIATRLVDTYVHNQPLKPVWDLAAAILWATMMGYDPPKKDQPPSEGAPETVEPTDGSITA